MLLITMIIFINIAITILMIEVINDHDHHEQHDLVMMTTMTMLMIIRETVEHVRLALLVEDLAAQGARQVVATRFNKIILIIMKIAIL